MSDIIIRAATIADALYILKIYGYYVEKTAVSFEYTVPSVLEFSKRIDNPPKIKTFDEIKKEVGL